MPSHTAAGKKVYGIIGPDEIEATTLGPAPLCLCHGEALRNEAVWVEGNPCAFSCPADQAVCAGTWTVTRQAVNGSAATPVVIEIRPE